MASRQNPGDLGGELLDAAFKTDVKKLPAFVGSNSLGGYSLVKISKVVDAPALDDTKRKLVADRLTQQQSQEEFDAMVKSLRSKAKITIQRAALEQKTDQ